MSAWRDHAEALWGHMPTRSMSVVLGVSLHTVERWMRNDVCPERVQRWLARAVSVSPADARAYGMMLRAAYEFAGPGRVARITTRVMEDTTMPLTSMDHPGVTVNPPPRSGGKAREARHGRGS
jgi:hypothetical protein